MLLPHLCTSRRGPGNVLKGKTGLFNTVNSDFEIIDLKAGAH